MSSKIGKAALNALGLCVLLWTFMIVTGESLSQQQKENISQSEKPTDNFDLYLKNDIQPADGFDFPVGNADGKGTYRDPKTGKTHRGWYVATGFGEEFSLGIHPGEDWNGRGGGNTDLGQPVHALATGRVVFSGDCGRLWGRVVVIEHVFYQNHSKWRIQSLYAHLGSLNAKKGDLVRRRQKIGTVGQDPDKKYHAHLHLELRRNLELKPNYWPSSHDKSRLWIEQNYLAPAAFIRDHRKLFVPTTEPHLVLVDQASYRMRLYQQGKQVGEYLVAFGQGKGRKRLRGDNRTPKGMYFVIDRRRGEFKGLYGAFYGGHWIKFNYPNRYDAAWGRQNGYITKEREKHIAGDWQQRKPTDGKSRLGGGIGFHGWIAEWDDSGGRHLSWGCIVMHNSDIAAAYDRIPNGSMVVIF